MRMPRPALLALLLLSLAAAGCGSDDEGSAASDTTDKAAKTTATEPTQTEKTTETTAAADLTDTSKKPEIAKPSGSPPRKLVKEDIVKGKGTVAKSGDTATVQYVGVSFSTGEEFDASWDRGQPFPFVLGAQQVISGWDNGIVGMKVGGRRQLTIPPEQAYGAEGRPPSIGPNETLIFVVDLKKVS